MSLIATKNEFRIRFVFKGRLMMLVAETPTTYYVPTYYHQRSIVTTCATIQQLHLFAVDLLKRWTSADWKTRPVELLVEIVELIRRRGLVLDRNLAGFVWDPLAKLERDTRITLAACINLHDRLFSAPRAAVVSLLIMWRFRDVPFLSRLPRDVIKLIAKKVTHWDDDGSAAKIWWACGAHQSSGQSVFKCRGCSRHVSCRSGLSCVLCLATFHRTCTKEPTYKGDMYTCQRCANLIVK